MKSLSIVGFAPVIPPPSFGPAAHLQWIPIEQLVVDTSYQREMRGAGRKNVRDIAAEFNWAYFAPLMVAPIEGGHYSIIDGQHRATAAMLLGIKQVPCAVVIADRQTQAAAFEAVNAKTTRIHTTQIFHASIAAGDERALATKRVLDEAGVMVLKGPGAWRESKNKTIAVRMVSEVASRDPDVAVLTLKLIRMANDLDCYSGSFLSHGMIGALFDVLQDHKDWRAALSANPQPFLDLPLDELWARASIGKAKIRGTTFRDQLQAALIDELDVAMRRLPAKARREMETAP